MVCSLVKAILKMVLHIRGVLFFISVGEIILDVFMLKRCFVSMLRLKETAKRFK